MHAFILVGSTEKQQEYLNSFYSKNNVKDYCKHEFPEFKILDARNLSHLLSQKLPTSEKRVITIKNPTHEAQNAILKLTEELPDSSFIFFLVHGKEDLLSTIISRSQVVDLGGKLQEFAHEDLKGELKSALRDTSLFLSFCNAHIAGKESMDSVMLALRDILVENPQDIHTYLLLKKMLEISPFIKQNNVQAKFSLEATLLNIDTF